MSVKDEGDVYSEAKDRTLNLIDFDSTDAQIYDNRQGQDVPVSFFIMSLLCCLY